VAGLEFLPIESIPISSGKVIGRGSIPLIELWNKFYTPVVSIAQPGGEAQQSASKRSSPLRWIKGT